MHLNATLLVQLSVLDPKQAELAPSWAAESYANIRGEMIHSKEKKKAYENQNGNKVYLSVGRQHLNILLGCHQLIY